MKLFNKKKEFQCYVCNDLFAKYKEMLNHAKNIHNKNLGKCPLCKDDIIQERIAFHVRNAHHKVSLPWRMAFCWTPWAYLEIRKFWLSAILAHVFTFGITITIILIAQLIGSSSWKPDDADAFVGFFVIGYFVIPILPMLFLMRKWATEWNKQIDSILMLPPNDDSI